MPLYATYTQHTYLYGPANGWQNEEWLGELNRIGSARFDRQSEAVGTLQPGVVLTPILLRAGHLTGGARASLILVSKEPKAIDLPP